MVISDLVYATSCGCVPEEIVKSIYCRASALLEADPPGMPIRPKSLPKCVISEDPACRFDGPLWGAIAGRDPGFILFAPSRE
jgi:hypothetical protein